VYLECVDRCLASISGQRYNSLDLNRCCSNEESIR